MSEVKIWHITNMPTEAGSEFVSKRTYDAKVRELDAKLQSKHEEYIHAQTVYKKSRDECVTLKAHNEKLKTSIELSLRAHDKYKKHGLTHYEDCAFLEYEENENDCDCGVFEDHIMICDAAKLARQVLKELGLK